MEEKSIQFPILKFKPIQQKIDELHNKMKKHFNHQKITLTQINQQLINHTIHQIQKAKTQLTQLRSKNNVDQKRKQLLDTKNHLVVEVKQLIKLIQKTKITICKLNFKQQEITKQVGSKNGILKSLNDSLRNSTVKNQNELLQINTVYSNKTKEITSRSIHKSQIKQNKWPIIEKLIEKINNLTITKLQNIINGKGQKQNSRRLFKNYNLDAQFQAIITNKQFQKQMNKIIKNIKLK